MRDLTRGPVMGHLITMALPIMFGMLFQTAYFLVDLWFVGRLGNTAIAGVGAAGNLTFLVMAVTQVLAVGAVALISQAAGRKDPAEASLVFNQSLLLGAAGALLTLLVGYTSARHYVATTTPDAATQVMALAYLRCYLPSLAMQFVLVAMGSALRGTGIVKPAMTVQMLTVLINIVLAPVLIGGWGTGRPLGVAGAGLASSIAVGVGVLMMIGYFLKLEHYVGFSRRALAPRPGIWRRIFAIGLPSGAEFLIMFLIFSVIYWAIRSFGPSAQAGFSVGSRVMQAIFLPALAISFSVAPVVGQNFGAGHPERVRATFKAAALLSAIAMGLSMIVALLTPRLLVRQFTQDPAAIAVGIEYLRYISWNFITTGFVMTCSSLMQGLGNTLPVLWSSGSRVLTFALPVIWMASHPGFTLTQIWYTSIGSVALQALLSGYLANRQIKLSFAAVKARVQAVAQPAAPAAGAATEAAT
jgi:putative MATE family efflux protein